MDGDAAGIEVVFGADRGRWITTAQPVKGKVSSGFGWQWKDLIRFAVVLCNGQTPSLGGYVHHPPTYRAVHARHSKLALLDHRSDEARGKTHSLAATCPGVEHSGVSTVDPAPTDNIKSPQKVVSTRQPPKECLIANKDGWWSAAATRSVRGLSANSRA